MKWVTRERPKTDRIACPWLIRRFIDADAEIVYVPPDRVLTVAAESGGHSFDTPGAEYAHHTAADGYQRCTFEVLVDAYGLVIDPGLSRLAKIVHAADINGEVGTDPAGAGLLAIGVGGLLAESDDQRLLDRATFVYDALYAWCQNQS